MDNEKVSFFLPVRKGSQRVINKSTRQFADFPGGLLELKIRQLLQSMRLDEIVLSTNDEEAIRIAREIEDPQQKLRVEPRPDHLCLDTTALSDLIRYVPSIIQSKHILWGHVTTPFVQGDDYDLVVEQYWNDLENGYDSLLSVSAFQNFLLNSEGRVFNSDSKEFKWPRTQDLPTLYEVNHAVFLAPRETYIKQNNRLGTNPALYKMDKIKSWDIDWEDDFTMAEAIYEKLRKL
ncbi:acylneuraminate cytidylyltransferase family protein [Algoriphagus sp. C2-6-M1]|uniref:acylneuraminate cytidylyltransferase family protein n=1 Tax=Algoriphagus persicinus TaxID=3108754 RepID=UPI002B3D893C|nr:acylneuraminate cytidylyltransferase family protein [Algoriphagus sp. C2-6-M1]MEB2782432.1 acylneuraminate cytidylyltransferase family protein [Algoriphagus sp. C2-6-M1]